MTYEYQMEYYEKLLKAAIIAMDTSSPQAAGYLLREICWERLSAAEILQLIKIAHSQPEIK